MPWRRRNVFEGDKIKRQLVVVNRLMGVVEEFDTRDTSA